MALKGLDIFKLSPKKNCKECGSPTCMAFCMKVAQGAVSIDKCPYFSDDAKAMLNEQTAPPMKTITVGDHKLGGETVLFRHEKTLVNKNLYAVSVCTCMSAEEADKKLADLQKVDYERIGERMYVEFVFVANKQSDPAVYAELVKKAAATGRDLILECWDVECAKAALAVAGKNVILDGATPDNYEAMNAVAKEAGVVLGVHADTISDLYDTVKKLEAAGNKNLVLDVTGKTAKETLANAVLVRRTAIKDGDRSFGYPSIVNVGRIASGDDHLQTAYASMFTEKYGSIIVMEHMTYAQALPLYGLRQNIFTDPQKPMKVAPGIYPVNGAGPDDPCALTVDFALTYFLVSGELERSNQPVNLIITDASGMSVLTAWAAGKFSSSTVKKTFETLDIENKIKNRTLIIPGKVAVMKGEIQEKLPGWNVVVGPTEAVQLPKYMKDKEYEAAAKAAEQGNADALAALGIVEHADVADAEGVVPTFRGTLDEACQLPVLKCAEGDRVFQPLAEENIVKALFCGCFKGRILYLKALPGSANVVIAVCLILGGEFFARVDFLVQLPDLHSISSANGTSRTETVREVIQY